MSVALNQPEIFFLKAKDSSIKVPMIDNLWHSVNVVIECNIYITLTYSRILFHMHPSP